MITKKIKLFLLLISSAFVCSSSVMALRPHSAAMVRVQGGSYSMGDAVGTGERDELPVRKVKVNSFSISSFEVTFEEFDKFCEDVWKNKPNDYGMGRGNKPVINICWYDAIQYCNWLSRKEGYRPCYSIRKLKEDGQNLSQVDLEKWTVLCNFTRNGYRLPTEAEWEFAARGGIDAEGWQGSGSNNVNEVGWYLGNSDNKIHSVGSKTPNVLGIYDMSGNVWEFCWDWYAETYYNLTNDNPTGVLTGEGRVVRGGSFENNVSELRIANRNYISQENKNHKSIGFRLVRTSR